MGKRKYPPIKTEAYVHVGDKLVNTKDLNPEQKRKLGDWILLTWFQNLYRGEAVFWLADQPGPEDVAPDGADLTSSDPAAPGHLPLEGEGLVGADSPEVPR